MGNRYKNQPLVSIITVVLNGERHIEDTIKSVLSQTYNNIEYIVVDGKSSDGTIDIVNKYSSSISHIISEKDDGLYYAMNKGIKIASGEIIGIINSDDYYGHETVSIIVKKYRQYGKKCIYHGSIAILNKQRIPKKNIKKNIKSLSFMRSGCTIAHPSVFVPKYIYDNYGNFNTKYRIASDYDFLLRLLKKYSIRHIYINRCLAYFNTGGISSNITEVINESHSARLNNNLNFVESYFYFSRSYIYNYIKNTISSFKKY